MKLLLPLLLQSQSKKMNHHRIKDTLWVMENDYKPIKKTYKYDTATSKFIPTNGRGKSFGAKVWLVGNTHYWATGELIPEEEKVKVYGDKYNGKRAEVLMVDVNDLSKPYWQGHFYGRYLDPGNV